MESQRQALNHGDGAIDAFACDMLGRLSQKIAFLGKLSRPWAVP
jgi:hypothetical protein